MTTVAEEKRFNPRLGLDVSLEEFRAMMAQVHLPCPSASPRRCRRTCTSGLGREAREPDGRRRAELTQEGCHDVVRRRRGWRRSTTRIANPEIFRFVGSMEGVPEWVDPAEAAEQTGWRARGHSLLEAAARLAPGLLLALGIAALASAAAPRLSARAIGLEAAPISPILLAILAGLLLRNTVGLPLAYDPGIQLAVRRILRLGVALLGIRLSLPAALDVGRGGPADRRSLRRGRAAPRRLDGARAAPAATARDPDRRGHRDLRQLGDRGHRARDRRRRG